VIQESIPTVRTCAEGRPDPEFGGKKQSSGRIWWLVAPRPAPGTVRRSPPDVPRSR